MHPFRPSGSCANSSFPNSFTNSFLGGGSYSLECDLLNHLSPLMADELARTEVLEAEFCQNFLCCGETHQNMHDLMEHHEETHADVDCFGPAPIFEEDWSGSDFEPLSSLASPCKPNFTLEVSPNDYTLLNVLDQVQVHVDQPFQAHFVDANPNPLSIRPEPIKLLSSNFLGMSPASIECLPDSMFTTSEPSQPIYQSKIEMSQLDPFPSPVTIPMPQGVKRARDEAFLQQRNHIKKKDDRPYLCKVPGCKKKYKNSNGLKYHEQNGHKRNANGMDEDLMSKPYRCTYPNCGKSYKNVNGLKYHLSKGHREDIDEVDQFGIC